MYVPGGAAAGSTVQVWINRSGQQAGPPLAPGQITGRAQLAEELTVIALVIVGWLIHRRLNARRLAGWDADWLAHGPRWSPRR